MLVHTRLAKKMIEWKCDDFDKIPEDIFFPRKFYSANKTKHFQKSNHNLKKLRQKINQNFILKRLMF